MTAVSPNLPKNNVRLALCGEFSPMTDALSRYGIEVITVRRDHRLPQPVAHHADMICCHAAENTIVTADVCLKEKLEALGVSVLGMNGVPGSSYPEDCALNCLVVGKRAFGRTASLDSALKNTLSDHGIEIIDVRQGYARCSAAVVDQRSAVTADKGIAAKMTSCGFDVLLISPGGIRLDGYDYGFIGGCCGKISENVMLFCGDPALHPDGSRILSFLAERNISAECACRGELTDFGGFIPLFE